MMCVGDCYCERVGGIWPCDPDARKKARDHRVDLHLLGIAVADDSFLHETRGIFANVDIRARGTHQDDTARLTKLQRRLRVLIDEDFLDRGAIGALLGNQQNELVRKRDQAHRERVRGFGPDMPIGNMGKAVAFGFDHAPAGRAEAGVEPEDPQVNFSNSSSGTS